MEYISLHGYIRNTPSDTEVHAEHQLRAEEVPDQRKRIYEPHKTQQDKRTRGENGVLIGLNLPSVDGGIEAGVRSPHPGNCLSQRRNI